MSRQEVRIAWEYDGTTDISAGTGASAAEKLLPVLCGVGLACYVAYQVKSGGTAWTVTQWIVGLILAFDVGGGAVANSLNSAKRFYHSPRKAHEGRLVGLVKNQLVFAALHVHAPVAYLTWQPAELWVGLLWYALLLAGAGLVSCCPLYLARPVAAAVLVATIATHNELPAIDHLAWLIPLLFFKIVFAHGVREEPYRPVR